MIPRMTALIALLALLLSGPAFGAESLGSVPQTEKAEVVDAVADKQVLDLPPQNLRPTPEPNKNGMDAATEVEMQRGFNELRSEFLDKSSKVVEWWLAGMAILLTVFSILAAVVGYVSFEKISQNTEEAKKARDDVLEEAKKARDDVLEEAKKARDDISRQMEEVKALVMEIKLTRDVAREHLEKLNAESVNTNPGEAARAAVSVRGDPATPPIDRAIAVAVLLQRQGKIEEAIEQWRSVATVAGEENPPLQARAWFSIGYLRSVGEGIDLGAAIDAYTKAIELDPTLADAYNNRGTAKHKLGQHAAALADYNRAIELDPTLAAAYNNRGTAKHKLGQHAAALADYNRAIELNPTYAIAHNNRGNAKHKLGQHAAALTDLDRAIELDPTLAIAYDSRGEVKHKLGQHAAALTDLDRAIELDPTLAEAYNNRGNTKESLGRITEAREDYQEALALAQEAGDEEVVTKAQDNLSRLDNNEAPGPQGQ